MWIIIEQRELLDHLSNRINHALLGLPIRSRNGLTQHDAFQGLQDTLDGTNGDAAETIEEALNAYDTAVAIIRAAAELATVNYAIESRRNKNG